MTRNLFLPLILSLLGLLNGLFYLSAYGQMSVDANTVLMASLFLIVMIEIMIGGRVIPSFTANAIAGLHQFKSKNLASITLVCSASAFLLYIFSFGNYLTSIICLLAGCLQLLLQWGWRPLATVSKPMVWVLQAAYAWISLGFIFLGLSSLGILSVYIALHAFGIGATGGLIIGMITRTAMGHTGRKIHAGYIEKTCYVLVQLTAIIWMIAHVTTGAWFHATIGLAGVCWCLTFILYIFKYLPWLTRARFDGQAG
jgi:uncharacterized protein involved in response to NO